MNRGEKRPGFFLQNPGVSLCLNTRIFWYTDVTMLLLARGLLRAWIFVSLHPRLISLFFLTFFIIGGVFLPEVFVQAADATTKQNEPDIADRALLFLAEIASSFAQAIGSLIVLLIGIMLPIMQYNNFANSPVIGAGWAIVRDTTNMFFVIILITIAMGTIFGHSKFHWEQQIPKLVFVAIIINFSRTLCGLMIDFGQVIMLTFANAIKDIAGGNIIQLFGLNSIMEFDTTYIQNNLNQGAQATGIQSFDLFAASLAAVILMSIVFVTMIFLVLILVYRIVILWVLVVMAPLAWFFKVTDGVFKAGGDPYGDWWKRFVCAVAIGPVIVFFLWLALAVAGSGSIAATENFATGGGPQETSLGGILEIMGAGHLTSFIIAIAMIFAGFEAAQRICQGVEGISGQVSKMSKAGRGVLTRAENLGKGTASYAYRQTLGRPVDWAQQKTAKGLESIATSSATPRFMAASAGRGAESLRQKQREKIKGSIKGEKAMSAAAKANYLRGGPTSGLSGIQKQKFLARSDEWLKDKEVLKQFTPEELSKLLNSDVRLEGTIGGKDRRLQDVLKEQFGGDNPAVKEMRKKHPATMGEKFD